MVSVYLILLFSILSSVVGQFLLKKGMIIIGPQELSFKVVLFLIKSIFNNIYIFFGLVCYGLSFISWLLVLSKIKLSAAYPALSLIYVFVIIGSYFLFKETITVFQIIGIFLIIGGLFFIFK